MFQVPLFVNVPVIAAPVRYLANRVLTIGCVKLQALGGEPIDMGRVDAVNVVRRQLGPEVIYHDEEDIRRLLPRVDRRMKKRSHPHNQHCDNGSQLNSHRSLEGKKALEFQTA